MKEEHLIKIILIIIGVALIVVLGDSCARYSMKKESLEGYRAFATYGTNSVGEVTIKSIEWKKPH